MYLSGCVPVGRKKRVRTEREEEEERARGRETILEVIIVTKREEKKSKDPCTER